VPSLDVAMREMDFAPFHAALRADDAAAAVREAAALVGVPEPKAAPMPKTRPEPGAAEAVDHFLAGVRPRLARGRWIDEWLADRALPNADLTEVRLRMATGKDGLAPDVLAPDVLQDEHFRKLIGANTHEGVEYFSKEGFDSTLKALDVTPAKRKELAAAAEKSGYRLDRLAEALKPASTTVPNAETKTAAKGKPKPAARKPRK